MTVAVIMYVKVTLHKQILLILNKNLKMILANLGKFYFLMSTIVKGPSLSDPDLKLKPQCICR